MFDSTTQRSVNTDACVDFEELRRRRVCRALNAMAPSPAFLTVFDEYGRPRQRKFADVNNSLRGSHHRATQVARWDP